MKDKKPETLELVGPAEAAEILGWDPRRVHTYIKRKLFPEPYARIKATRLWTREQIEAFKVDRERRRTGKELSGNEENTVE